eukprot:4354872-Alexandrium_andersonii.AAC.1
MSASLVGSEMCIRDREDSKWAGPVPGRPPQASAAGRASTGGGCRATTPASRFAGGRSPVH